MLRVHLLTPRHQSGFFPSTTTCCCRTPTGAEWCPSNALCRYGRAMVGTVARCWWTVSGGLTGESCPTVVGRISTSKHFSRCLDVRRLPWPPRDYVCSPLPRLTPRPVTSGFQFPEIRPVLTQPAHGNTTTSSGRRRCHEPSGPRPADKQ